MLHNYHRNQHDKQEHLQFEHQMVVIVNIRNLSSIQTFELSKVQVQWLQLLQHHKDILCSILQQDLGVLLLKGIVIQSWHSHLLVKRIHSALLPSRNKEYNHNMLNYNHG